MIGHFLSLFKPKKKDRLLGVSLQGERRYDLPLDKDPGAGFLMLLTGLLTFLAILALLFTLVANTLSSHWVSGLAGKLTIEIPAHTADGKPRSAEDLQNLTEKVQAESAEVIGINTVTPIDSAEVKQMIQPFLGDISGFEDLPLPALLSVEFSNQNKDTVKSLKSTLAELDAEIRIDTHEDWLSGILRLSHALNISALGLMVIVLCTTVLALVSAIRARMKIHHGDIELLHLMGATNIYIARQFQRHASVIALRGSIIGASLGVILFTVLMMFVSNGGEMFNLSSFSFSTNDFLLLLATPFIISIIAQFSARLTVLRALAQMP